MPLKTTGGHKNIKFIVETNNHVQENLIPLAKMTRPYVHIIESMPMGIIVIDLMGYVQTINKHAKSILNMTAEPIIHKHIHTLLGELYTIPVANFFQAEQFEEAGSYKIKNNGRILDMVRAPLSGDQGVLQGAVITITDVTEIERTRELEKNNEKYAAMGELSADIAHEIRNPLGSIELLASLLKKELKRKKDINRADQIMAAVRNMENKISSLIQFSNTYQIPVTCVNINDILKDILHFSEKIIDREAVFLSAQYTHIEPVIECNPDMIKQVFLNLILNALQALPETGRLDIITHYLEKHRVIEICFIEKSIRAPESIPSNILSRLSHKQKKNWGLGLAIIHNIINMYNGSVRLEYREDGGTAFVLSFPLVDKKNINGANDPVEKKDMTA
jgi:PAS domain S-box-containing protein